ncbi:DUF2142 domain-containing protein [Agromyces sp. MMS24-JH15]|uniref:DUF2142 domain-containing protein n=1 Tax=Agromyces sp. MMS24-JH15 TaxID=3243765 RepID=UPI00374948CF
MSTSPTPTRADIAAAPPAAAAARRQGRLVFAATWMLTAVIGILWALATPIGGSPDEPAHLVKAASVARGQFVGEPSHIGHIVQVPRYVAAAHGVGCMVFEKDVPADCIAAHPENPGEIADSTTTAGLYNPVYYLLVGWPSLLFGDITGIYAMRIVSVVLTTLFIAFAARLSLGLGRPALSLAAVGVVATPTLLFLTGAVNPNALEVTTTLAAFTAMLAVVRRGPEASIGGPLAIAIVSTVLGVQMRGLSPLWFAVALAAPLILIPWDRLRALLQRRVVWVTVAAVLAATVLAALWTVSSSSLTGSLDDKQHMQQYPGVGTSFLTGFAVTLLDTFNHGTQMIASFGWLDTPAPQAVYFVWSALTGALVLAGVAILRGRRLVFGSAIVLALVLLPPLAQAAYVTAGGYIWQGRYTLPLFAIAVVGLAVVIGERAGSAARADPVDAEAEAEETARSLTRLFAVVWAGWALSQAYCYAIALKRNAAGADATWAAVIRDPAWAAPGGNALLMGVFAVVVLSTAFAAWWATARRRQRAG